ncbi:MAG: 4-(cytidine 5'-diphospho)-2-C-methyl-D-erythritol kinase [Gammaproteobacteria bacterium]
MMTGYWPAPAKVNLFLHITGRRDDGYHNLQTLFQFLTLHDRMYFSPNRDGSLSRQGNYPEVAEQQDLIIRAAQALQQATGCSHGADIKVEKFLPTGGGLGGGSSNAATTLLALNLLWETGLGPADLAEIGLSLGADVPVFVHGRAAWAEGTGEILQPTDAVAESPYLVIWPGLVVPTARIFSDPDLTRNTPAITMQDFLSGTSHNDCEPVVRKGYAEIDRAMRWLDERAVARLTGTGGCIFAAFPTPEQAEAVRAELPPEWSGFVTQGLNQSPLLEKVKRYGAGRIDDGA